MLDSAERLAPDNRTLIEHQFVRATLERNWEQAQRVVERAADANVDLAHGALYKGRLALARGNFEQAVREILPATEELSYSAYAWRLLGMAYEGVGNISDARRSYQRSYECNPNDLATLRIYCELLVRIGDPQRAITILRNAVNLLSDTSPAVEFWLGLEAEYGDMGVVLKRRRDMYERSSENSINGLKLASLLGQVKPRRDLIFSADGNPQYAGTRWDRMSSDEQRRILDDERAKWLDESESILKALESHGVRGLAIVSVRARNALARQQVAEGEQLLRAFIEEQRAAGTLKVNMVLALGQYLAEARRYEEARDVFLSARELQDAQRQEADLMLGEFFFRGNRFEQAAEAYQRVADNGGAPVTRQRLVECYIKTRQYEQAAAELERLLAVAPADYISVMLEAALAEGRGETLHAAGRIEEANAEFAKQQASLDRATAMAPSQPMPHVQRAIAYLAEYRRTQDAAVLDEAMSALDTAAAMRSDFPAVSIARADVLLARGNLDMAIGELGRLLQKAPESIPVRRRLIELLLNSGRVNEAGNVLLDATTLFPDSPMWFEYYGDLKVAQGDVNAAEPMYAKAFQLDSTPSLLAKLATARLRLVPPNARGAADLLAAHINTVEQDPTLRGIYAEALHKSGRELMALEQMRASYQQFRDAIARKAIGPEMISQWYVQLRKLYDPPRFADMEQFVREVANDKLAVYDVQWLARIWSDGDSDSLKRAIELQNEALEMVPKEQLELRLGLLNDLSLFYTRAGDYSRAIEVMEQLITEQPNNAMALNNLAYLMGERSHDLKRAISHAERANELKPNDPNILDTLGVLLMLDGQYPRAEEFLRRSTELAPVAGTYLHMAQLLSRMGQPRYKVENAIRRAEELNPDPKTRAEIDALLDDMRKTSP